MTTVLESSGAGIELHELTKKYGEFIAADSISLTVNPGEFITFLGPSGSGKTTTLNMVAGFVKPDTGVIKLDDKDIAMLPPYKRDLGVVFQNYALFPNMTVWENIEFPLKARKVKTDEAATLVERALELVGLENLSHRLPKQLSGGQQQRVAFARAIVFSPRALLMDEPLGALDKRLKERLQVEIRRLHRELGITIIYVTHDQEEALALSDRIVVFKDGVIQQVDRPEVLYSSPVNEFVASFIGESNLYEAEFAEALSDGNMRVETEFASFVVEIPELFDVQQPQELHLLIRPESFTYTEAARSTDPMADQSFACRVEETVFLGSTTRIRAVTFDGKSVLIDTANSASTIPAVNAQIPVSVKPEDIRVIVRRESN